VNANTGSVIADLPDLELSGMFGCTMMRYETQTASLPLSSAPDGWVNATRPGAVWVVCLDDDGQTPLWGGMVIDRETTHGGSVELSLATPEAYFDRRFVGDVTYTATAQNLIAKDLVEDWAKTGSLRGIPIRVQIVGGNGVARDHTYADSGDKTLYSVLGELSGLVGGPEWTVGWEHVNSLITPVFYVGDRVGAAAPVGLGPAAQFYLAVSSGVDDARPQSAPQSDATDLRPTFEYRWTPSTSIKETETLNDHAARALAAMRNGGIGLELTANRAEAPKLGRDWFIGDEIGFDLTAPAWPDGITGTGRAVGWRMDANTIQPLIDVTSIGGI
jgi:hypothetical protein